MGTEQERIVHAFSPNKNKKTQKIILIKKMWEDICWTKSIEGHEVKRFFYGSFLVSKKKFLPVRLCCESIQWLCIGSMT